MPTTREKIVKQAQSWLGCKESDGSHRQIIDVYNADKPLPRGYKMSYTNAWCATFVTACAIKCDATDIIPKECSCNKMIELFKKFGCFIENDAYVPLPADILFYDWNDSGSGDNVGVSDHVGIVEKVSGDTVTVIEGNYNNACKRRTMKVNGRYIRGYGVPKYTASTVASATTETKGNVTITLPILVRNSRGESVRALQSLLNLHGASLTVDGSYGPATENAVKAFQTKNGLSVDGKCGPVTWGALLT